MPCLTFQTFRKLSRLSGNFIFYKDFQENLITSDLNMIFVGGLERCPPGGLSSGGLSAGGMSPGGLSSGGVSSGGRGQNISWRSVPWRPVRLEACPPGGVSSWRPVLLEACPPGGVSAWRRVLLEACPTGGLSAGEMTANLLVLKLFSFLVVFWGGPVLRIP